jgi:U4/U6.U5 tri-snRNP-associated protein 2
MEREGEKTIPEPNKLLKKRGRDEFTSNDEINNSDRNHLKAKIECPYLGTIKRHFLDFDFEKVCSISQSRLNVYACLICGKYFQGRATNTHAYIHSLEKDHHLFINLNDQRIYCLPDGYGVQESSLNDIKYNCKPLFSRTEIDKLDQREVICKALDGSEFLPGSIGLNNIKRTDYVNVIIQALSRVTTIRNFFLVYENANTDLVRE